jgi:ABC-type multidrug transport system fused ATPase/permease subunit
VLSYTLSITQTFCKFPSFFFFNKISTDTATATMVQQFAQNEQNMNAVERVLVYTELPPEGDTQTPNDPPASWPEKGEIKFREVELAYREGLPLVLKGINFRVAPGEKVGTMPFMINWRLTI